jgi:hypothetical protein
MALRFRFKFSKAQATAWVEISRDGELIAKPSFKRDQLESAITQLEQHRADHGNKAYRYPQTKLSLNPANLHLHIDRLNRLLDVLFSTPDAASQSAGKPEPSRHSEAGPAHGGASSASDTGAAWQGFGSGMGGGGGGGPCP